MIKCKGYTLIEVLVSMVIFSILITLAVSSYRYFFSATASKNSQAHALSLLSQRKIINTSIKALEPYYYVDYDNKSRLFFLGEKERLSFVSYNPSYLNEPLTISTLFLAESGNELYYCEQALGTISLMNYRFRERDCLEKKLYLKGENIRFSYFSWKNALELDSYFSEYLNVNVKPKPQWRSQYDSAETLALPLYIKISTSNALGLLPNEFMFEVPQELPIAKRDKHGFAG
ncbi:hypothetical protein GCM10009111_13140 [Colwellia asteriadis]|uniref:Prepilin-type N-terminal cleavage/methylation domain-containing protein n=1 Tax=Colwellia asteriadis TaxID=517723 RepID=A0ABP3WEP8_9GAMM